MKYVPASPFAGLESLDGSVSFDAAVAAVAFENTKRKRTGCRGISRCLYMRIRLA